MRVLFSRGIAALSKPRCGSTSLRRMLDPLLRPEAGDIAVDRGDQNPPFHPHVTAPFLHRLLRERGHDPERLRYIITVRHPLEMLWSYYKFFRPDTQGRYRFMPGWDESGRMPFERWILHGRLAVNRNWLALGPAWVSPDDLSPLSLEFRAMDRHGRMLVDEIFRIEEPERLAAWLEERTGERITVVHSNRSPDGAAPAIGREALERIRAMMPRESRLYGL